VFGRVVNHVFSFLMVRPLLTETLDKLATLVEPEP
jgi:hypothetical protein